MQQILGSPILHTLLIIIIPVVLLPLLMRYVIGKIIILRAKKHYLPSYLQNQSRGWHEKSDKQAIESLNSIALQRLKGAFIFKPDIQTDIKTILLCIQNIYYPGAESAELSFSFSIKKFLDCALLFFSDFFKDYAHKKWFKLIRNIRIIWLYRMWNIKKYYEILFSNPLMDKLRRMRLLGKVLRLALIPLIGLPSLVWYVLRSIIISVFFEGFYRFFYALMLLKISYYALYLYGRENKNINQRISAVPKQKLTEISKQIESMIRPGSWEEKSSLYEKAVTVYQAALEELGIAKDQAVSEEDGSFLGKAMQVLDRIKKAFSKTYTNANPFIKKQVQGNAVLEIILGISAVYMPRSQKPYRYLRLKELITAGYMASIIIIRKIMTTPGANLLLEKLSVDFALKITAIARQDTVIDGAKSIGELFKYYRLYRIGSRAIKVIRGISGPYGLILSLGSSVLIQQAKNLLYDYIIHTTARLTLFTWESHILKKDRGLLPLLV